MGPYYYIHHSRTRSQLVLAWPSLPQLPELSLPLRSGERGDAYSVGLLGRQCLGSVAWEIKTRKGLREAPFGWNHQWAQVLQIHPKSAVTDSRSPYPRLCCWALQLKPLHPLARLGTGGSVTISHVEEEVWGCRTQLKVPWVLRKETARLSASCQ